MIKLHYIFPDGRCEEKAYSGCDKKLIIPASSMPAGVKAVEIHDDRFAASAGENGYILMPNIENGSHHSFITFFKDREDCEETFRGNNIEIYGICRDNHATLAIIRGMKFDFELTLGVKAGRYTLVNRFCLDGEPAYEDIEIDFISFCGADVSWQTMAKYFRKDQLERGIIHTLQDKAAERPVLRELCECIDIRIRLAWKPAPSPIEDQTLENEPEVHAEITLKDVDAIIEEFHRQGIEHASICLVGWNISGHDGRFPDVFPVEPKCGTLEELKALTAKARSYGYLIAAHTNLIEGYNISQRLDKNDILVKPDGSVKRGDQWSGGRSYYLCPEMAYRHYLKQDMEDLKAAGFYGCHYFDVFSIVPPDRCCHPEHPLTRKENACWRNKILEYASQSIGAVSSEGGHNFCADVLDYVLYTEFFLKEKAAHPVCDEYVPLWPMIYHGIQIYNNFSNSVNAGIKSDRSLRVRNYLWGGRPIYYVNSKFMPKKSMWGEEDLRYHPSEEFPAQVAKIKKDYDFYRSIRHLLFEAPEHYEVLENGVLCMTFANGETLLGNPTDSKQTAKDRSLDPFEMVLI